MINKRTCWSFTIICMLMFFAHVASAATPVTPNASPQARALLNYLYSLNGKKILSGQQYAPWGIDEIATVYSYTGKYPALRGQDFIHERDNGREVDQAIAWWRAGGIPTFMWHWGAPSRGEGYDQSQLTIDISRCFQAGTAEHTAFWNDLRRIAGHLQRLKDANVPILWRPMHEFDGGWFWWGKGGGAQFRQLWTTVFDYLAKERNLNNLIWVLPHCGRPIASWNPGKAYYDIAGPDTYASNNSPQKGLWDATRAIHGTTIPIGFHEIGTIPDPAQCLRDGVMWSWWMLWHTGHLTNHNRTNLVNAYNHDVILTRDELPNIMDFLDGDQCTPTDLTPNVQINGATWLQTASASLSAGGTLSLGPQPATGGTWSWSGPGGFSASTREITRTNIQTNQAGTYTATFTNAANCKSSVTFTVTVTPSVSMTSALQTINRPSAILDKNTLIITGDPGSSAVVSLINLSGKIVYRKSFSGAARLQLNTITASGNYVLTVSRNKNVILSQKVSLTNHLK